MDTAVRKVSIAEHAQHAAEVAALTMEHAANPHEPDSPEHAEWQAAYTRSFHGAMNLEQEGSA